jgi:hypothetical protein
MIGVFVIGVLKTNISGAGSRLLAPPAMHARIRVTAERAIHGAVLEMPESAGKRAVLLFQIRACNLAHSGV